jgi:hypothetical protein
MRSRFETWAFRRMGRSAPDETARVSYLNVASAIVRVMEFANLVLRPREAGAAVAAAGIRVAASRPRTRRQRTHAIQAVVARLDGLEARSSLEGR